MTSSHEKPQSPGLLCVACYHGNRPQPSYKTAWSAAHKLLALCFTQSCTAVWPLHIWNWVTAHILAMHVDNTCNQNHCFQALGLSMYSQHVLVHKDAHMHALWGVIWKVLQDRVIYTWGIARVQWCVEAMATNMRKLVTTVSFERHHSYLGIQEAVHLNGRCPQ